NDAAVAKLRVGPSVCGVERDQAAVERAEQDAAIAAVFTLPVGNAAMLKIFARLSAALLRIELPDFCAGLRVEGDDAARRCGEIEDAINDERRGFKGRDVVTVGGVAGTVHFAGVVGPYALKQLHIVTVDLRER